MSSKSPADSSDQIGPGRRAFLAAGALTGLGGVLAGLVMDSPVDAATPSAVPEALTLKQPVRLVIHNSKSEHRMGGVETELDMESIGSDGVRRRTRGYYRMVEGADDVYTCSVGVTVQWFKPNSPEPVSTKHSSNVLTGKRGEVRDGIRQDQVSITTILPNGEMRKKDPVTVSIDTRKNALMTSMNVQEQVDFALASCKCKIDAATLAG